MVTKATCSEQICYEIHDPENYLTPDVVADFKEVKFTEVEKDKVVVEGAKGKPKTDTFKCSIGYRDCFIGDGEISYGGPGCLERAKLALDIIRERLELVAPGQFDEMKYDLIGCTGIPTTSMMSPVRSGSAWRAGPRPRPSPTWCPMRWRPCIPMALPAAAAQ